MYKTLTVYVRSGGKRWGAWCALLLDPMQGPTESLHFVVVHIELALIHATSAMRQKATLEGFFLRTANEREEAQLKAHHEDPQVSLQKWTCVDDVNQEVRYAQ